MKKLVVFGWLATAGMTLYSVFRKREDCDSWWSEIMCVAKDNFSFDELDEKIVTTATVILMILGAPVFALLYVLGLILNSVAAVN